MSNHEEIFVAYKLGGQIELQNREEDLCTLLPNHHLGKQFLHEADRETTIY